MSRLEIILSAIAFVSILFNVGLFLYARVAIVQLLSVSEELGDLQDMIDSFAGHLQSVYELETFYGDQTLSNLLDHAISFNKQLETFEYVYSLTEKKKEENETDKEIEQDDQ